MPMLGEFPEYTQTNSLTIGISIPSQSRRQIFFVYPIQCMSVWYIYIHVVDSYGIYVGKSTMTMDASWVLYCLSLAPSYLFVSSFRPPAVLRGKPLESRNEGCKRP